MITNNIPAHERLRLWCLSMVGLFPPATRDFSTTALADRTMRGDRWLVLSVAVLARSVTPIVAGAVQDIGNLIHWNIDSQQYIQLAESLTTGHFVLNGLPEVLRTPGYPLLVALGVSVGHPIGLTILLQIALGGVATLMVHTLAQQMALTLGRRDSRRIALLAGLFYALDPLSIVYSGLLLSETLFTTLLVAHLLVLSKHFETGSTLHVVLSGGLASALVFVRPVALFWLFLVGSVLLFVRTRDYSERPFVRFAPALIFLLVATTPLMLWSMRNERLTGYPGFSTAGDYNLYVMVGSAVEGIDWQTAEQRVDTLATQNGWTLADRYEYMRREGLRQIMTRPATYLAVHAKAVLQALTPGFSLYVRIYYPAYGSESTVDRLFGSTTPRLWDFLPALPVYLLVGVACATQYTLALAGVLRARRVRSWLTVLLFASAGYYLLMAGGVGSISYSRMRHPAMPAICVLAGFGASAAIGRYGPRRTDTPRV